MSHIYLPNFTYHYWFVDAPKKFMTHERVQIACFSNDSFFLNYMHFPISLSALATMYAAGTVADYLQEKFYDRASFVLPRGHYSLVQMQEIQFADDNKRVRPESRYISSHTTNAFSGNSSKTFIEIVWGWEQLVRISKITRGNHLQVLRILATFLLAAERIFATYNRMC